MVLLLSKPYLPTEDILGSAGTRAFGVPFDNSDEAYFVHVTSGSILMKAGAALLGILPKWGAYLAEESEDDVESGARLLPENQRSWWRKQRAWFAFDVLNNDLSEAVAMRVLSRLLRELLDERCCGVWIPSTGRFLPNDGTAYKELTRMCG